MTVDYAPITDRLRPMFCEAFRQHAMGERISWDLSFQVMAPRPGQMLPVLAIFAELPAAALGEHHMALAQVGYFGLNALGVEESVKGVVAQLLAMRSEALAQTNGKLTAPEAQGLKWPRQDSER